MHANPPFTQTLVDAENEHIVRWKGGEGEVDEEFRWRMRSKGGEDSEVENIVRWRRWSRCKGGEEVRWRI